MRMSIVFHNCADNVASQARKHWAEKELRLHELIAAKAGDEAQLELRVDYEPDIERYDVRAIVSLPTATLSAEALDAEIRPALHRVADLLEEALRLYKEDGVTIGAVADVDAASADSFPASDAPSWTPVTAVGNKL